MSVQDKVIAVAKILLSGDEKVTVGSISVTVNSIVNTHNLVLSVAECAAVNASLIRYFNPKESRELAAYQKGFNDHQAGRGYAPDTINYTAYESGWADGT